MSLEAMSRSAKASPEAAGEGLQFNDSLKDLKNLRKQLYSAADYFESSYNRDTNKQFVVESSKDYVSKALVNTVDHLGSVADKLNKFLDQKANEFSAINTQFTCTQQRLCTIEELVHSRGMLHHQLLEIEADFCNNKHTILSAGEALPLGKSNVIYGNRISSLPNDVQQTKNSLPKKPARMKANPPLTRRKEASPNLQNFSFSNNEPVRRPVSPHRRAFNLITKRSVSPSPSLNKGLQQQQQQQQQRRAISACRTREMRNSTETEVEPYTKKSKHLFKALLSLHNSRKPIQHNKYIHE